MLFDPCGLSCIVVLVGGQGSRLHPLSWEKPKPLMPLGGVPALALLLDRFKSCGVSKAILASGYGYAQMCEFAAEFAGRFPFALQVYDEPQPLGTAGAVAALKQQLSGRIAVLNGDTLLPLDVGPMLALHQQRGAFMTMAATWTGDASRYGALRTDDQDWLTGFQEKSLTAGPGLINAGAYLLEEQAWRSLPPSTPCSLERDVFPSWLEHGRPCAVWRQDGYFLDIGTPESYLEAQALAMGGVLAPDRSLVRDGAWLGQEVLIRPPVFLGPGARVEDNVQLLGPVAVGAGCRIGAGSILSGCVLWENVSVGEQCSVYDSVLGSGVTLGSGQTVRRCAQVVQTPLGGEPPQEGRLRFF